MSEQSKNWFDKTVSLMEENTRGVQIGLYSVAIGGLIYALVSIKPFKKFASIKDIPSSFIERRIRLSGKVVSLELNPTKPIIRIDHTPIIGSRFRSSGKGLPINIAAVDMYPNAVSWLQHVAVGKDVEFTMLKRHPDSITSIVCLKNDNLGLKLVSLGFGSAAPLDTSLEKDKVYITYYKKLLEAEDKAENQGVGEWEQPKQSVWSRITSFLKNLVKRSNVPM